MGKLQESILNNSMLWRLRKLFSLPLKMVTKKSGLPSKYIIITLVTFLGNEMAIKSLVSGPYSANIQDEGEFTPLHLAAQNGK